MSFHFLNNFLLLFSNSWWVHMRQTINRVGKFKKKFNFCLWVRVCWWAAEENNSAREKYIRKKKKNAYKTCVPPAVGRIRLSLFLYGDDAFGQSPRVTRLVHHTTHSSSYSALDSASSSQKLGLLLVCLCVCCIWRRASARKTRICCCCCSRHELVIFSVIWCWMMQWFFSYSLQFGGMM